MNIWDWEIRVFIYDTSFSPELWFRASEDYKSNNRKGYYLSKDIKFYSKSKFLSLFVKEGADGVHDKNIMS